MWNMAQSREVYPGITVDQEIVHGKPVITGTRIPVSLVLGQLAGGVTYEEMEAEYHLTPEQVRAALAYASQVIASEPVSAAPRGA
jgi:uncharacterized protein (DUF433 family)